jgi:hypothetical protein
VKTLKKTYQSFIQAFVMFLDALPLFIVWLIIPLLILIAIYLYRTILIPNEIFNRTPYLATAKFLDPSGSRFELHASYPRKINFDTLGGEGEPLAIWMQRIPSSSPLQQISPGPFITNSTSLPSDTSMLTAAKPISFTIIIASANNQLLLTGEDKQPLPSQFVITPSLNFVHPYVFYLRPAVLDDIPWLGSSSQVYISIAGEKMPESLTPASVVIESRLEAGSRYIMDQLCGLPGLVIGVLASVAGFAMQQWGRKEEVAKRQIREKAIRSEFLILCRQKPAAAANRYIELLDPKDEELVLLRDSSPNWDKSISEIFSQNIDPPLKDLVDLWLAHEGNNPDDFSSLASELSTTRIQVALEYVKRIEFGEEWGVHTNDLLLHLQILGQNSGFSFPEDLIESIQIERRIWWTVQSTWENIDYWAPWSRAVTGDIESGIKFLEFRENPMGSTTAENDQLVIKGRYTDWAFLSKLYRDNNTSMLIVGACGSGKTSAAIARTEYLFKRLEDVLPIYAHVPLGFTMADLSKIYSTVLLRILAIKPTSFLHRGIRGRSAMVELLCRLTGGSKELILSLHQAGLPETGNGLETKVQIEKLSQGVHADTEKSDLELAGLISLAYPDSLREREFLLDIQPKEGLDSEVHKELILRCIRIVQILLQTKHVVKIFLPANTNRDWLVNSPLPVETLEWSQLHLQNVLKKRLEQVGGQAIRQWLKPERGGLPPVNADQLICEACHTPAEIIEIGNHMLALIGQKQDLLTSQELKEILLAKRDA